MKRFFQRSLLFLWLLLATAAAAVTVSAGQVDIQKLSEQATTQKYPDAGNVLLYDIELMTCQLDGTSVSTDEFYYKVLNEAGRKELASIPLHVNTNYGSAAFLTAEILRNGKKLVIDIAKHTTVTISTDQMRSNIYDPEIKVITLTVPGLEIGDILHIKTERKTLKPLIPGEWSTINQLEANVPILHYDVVIDMPSEMPLKNIVIKNPVKDTVKSIAPQHKNGRIIYKWQARNVPQAIAENDMPELYTCCQRLLAGTAENWQEISKWYYNLCRPGMDAVSDDMRKKVSELVKDAPNEDEKMRRIFKYVSQNIRYTGVTEEKKAPGFEPHDVRDTFKQKHGVCRDKAALLASMLELAGFKAFPVIFMAGTPKDSEVPNGYFNHAVACVDKGNYDYVLMDPTDENTRTLFPEYLNGQSYLVARPEGDILRRSPVVPAEKNKMTITTSAVIDSQGGLEGKSTIKLSGMSDLIYRSSFSRMASDKQLEFWQGKIRKVLPGAEVKSLVVTPENIRDTSLPVVIDFSFKADRVLPENCSTAVLAVPRFGSQFGTLNWLLPDTSLEKRRFPVKCDSSCMLEETFSLKLPPHIEVSGVPEGKGGGNENFSWNSKYSFVPGEITYAEKASLNSIEISEKDYLNFRAELNKYTSAVKRLPSVRKNYTGFTGAQYRKMFPDSDAVLLESDERLSLDSGCRYSRVVRKKMLVLNYAGIKKYAELKEYYFPSRESVDVEASVIYPDGSRRKLDKNHIREMDVPWTSDLKHVPAEKIKICALPGVTEDSVIEYTVTRNGRNLFSVTGCAVAGEHIPILKWIFTIDTPEKLKVYTSPAPSGIRYEQQSVQNRVIKTWRASNLAGLKKEYSQSELRFFAPHINYSSADVKEFPRRFNELLKEKLQGANSAAKAACFAGINDSADIFDKVRHIRDFVVRNVRVSGPALCDVPGEVLRTPDEIYKSSVGTSAERALLMASLFESAGIKYRFFLASSKPFHAQVYRNSFCLGPDFETVLLYVPELNSYFNCSSEYAQIGGTSCCGKLGMNLENCRISAITSSADALDYIRKDITINLKNNGSATLNVTEYFSGRYYEDINRKLSEMTPELRSRYFAAKVHALSSSAKLNGKYTYEFSKKRAVVKYSVFIPDFAHRAGDFLVYELPCHYILREKASVYGSKRMTPFVRREPDEISLNWKIIAPDGYCHEFSETGSTGAGHSNISKFTDRRRITESVANISMRLVQPVAYIDAADFDRLISVQNAVNKSQSRYGMLKKKTR